MTARAIKLLGTAKAEPKARVLTAGPLSCTLSDGAIRHIRFQGKEVLRGIAYLCRDKNWGTYTPKITGLKIRETKQGFTVSYQAVAEDSAQSLAYTAEVRATADGNLTFTATGIPNTDFLTNRSGFVVLHPLQGVVGKSLEIVHTDGARERTRFPKAISPGQPVFAIGGMTNTMDSAMTVKVGMHGDTWEMEDHRNWMDASYKTYVRSLLDPWPYTLPKGASFTQTIDLNVKVKLPTRTKANESAAIVVEVGATAGPMPSIGIALPMLEAAAALDASERIAAMKPGHLVAQIAGGIGGAARAAAAFREIKRRSGRPLHLEIILPALKPAAEEMREIAEEVRAGGLEPDAVIVTQAHDLKSFQPGAARPWGPSFEEMAAAARAAFPEARIGGGMLSYFTELNRKPPPKEMFDFITHTVCPIVHMADDVSVMETLEAIPSIAASARAIAGKTDYHIGPSSIPCRANPYGRAPAPNPEMGRVCLTGDDPRQRALFGAAWNLGLIAGFAAGGVKAICLGAATGKSGMIQGRAVTPLYRLIEILSAAHGAKRLRTEHSGGNRIAALAFRAKTGTQLVLANLTAETQAVKLKGFAGAAALTRLDAESYDRAVKGKPLPAERLKRVAALELSPYEVAVISPHMRGEP